MTSPGPALPSDLAARLFRALYTGYDLHTIGGIHVAVPKGAPCYTGRSLSEIARQLSDRHHGAQPPDVVSPGARIIATGGAGSDDSPTTATPHSVSHSSLPALQDRE